MTISTIDVREGSAKLFNMIGIETGSRCNRSCVFCPNHDFERPDEFMSMEMIEKIISDLASLSYKGRVEPYIYNEPMRDPRMLDIIRMIRAALPKACIMINTNADYFKSAEDVAAVFNAGLNQMALNVYSASDGCGDPDREARGVRLAESRFETLQSWVDRLGYDQTASLYTHIGETSRAASVFRKFGVSTDGRNFGGGFELQNRSGLIDWIPALKEPLARMCVRPFRVAQVTWKGDMVLCCNDYHGKVSAGNVADKHLAELWNSEVFNVYRLKLQNKKRDIFLCDTCDFRGGQYPHMVHGVTFGEERDREILASDLRADTTDLTIGKT